MRITDIIETPIRLQGNVANASVNFSEHTVSLVAVRTDCTSGGRPIVGVAFNSIGRFSQGGILRSRMIPRVLAANPDSLAAEDGKHLDPSAVLRCMMRNEKPGGHGDRAAAASAVELACWDANAKLDDEPAYATIARTIGREVGKSPRVSAYAAGGYYYPADGSPRFEAELRGYQDAGYREFKVKIGGASLAEDLSRIESAIAIIGDAGRLAVDANGRFDHHAALTYAKALRPFGLRWFEEPCEPLDYALLLEVMEAFDGPVATGENLFSSSDVRNLLRYGGMRPGLDVFQMDAGLSYGLTEYLTMVSLLEKHGFDRSSAYPHGGHLINLHIVAALGLGGCEAYPGVFQPLGGFTDQSPVSDGYLSPSDAPGFGLEEKPGLREDIAALVA